MSGQREWQVLRGSGGSTPGRFQKQVSAAGRGAKNRGKMKAGTCVTGGSFTQGLLGHWKDLGHGVEDFELGAM